MIYYGQYIYTICTYLILYLYVMVHVCIINGVHRSTNITGKAQHCKPTHLQTSPPIVTSSCSHSPRSSIEYGTTNLMASCIFWSTKRPPTLWFNPVTKWGMKSAITGLSVLTLLITAVISHLLNGVNHYQVNLGFCRLVFLVHMFSPSMYIIDDVAQKQTFQLFSPSVLSH